MCVCERERQREIQTDETEKRGRSKDATSCTVTYKSGRVRSERGMKTTLLRE